MIAAVARTATRNFAAANTNETAAEHADRVRQDRRVAAEAAHRERVLENARRVLADRGFATSFFLFGDDRYEIEALSAAVISYRTQRRETFERNHGHEVLDAACVYFGLDPARLAADRRYA